MARTSIFVSATPESVFDALARSGTYARAVGGKDAAEVGGTWPEPGSTVGIDHGVPPAQVRTTVAVERATRPTGLVLERRGPALHATIDVQVDSRFGAALVVLTERPVGGVLARVPGPLLDVALRVRDRRILGRLKRLAEARLQPG